jgi:hypothetical protein
VTGKGLPLLLGIAPLLAVGGFIACVTVYAIPGLLLAAVLLSFFLIPLSLVAIVLLAVFLARNYWPAAVALIPALIGLYVLVDYPRPYNSIAARSARWLQFAYYRSDLDTRAAQSPKTEGNGPLVVLAVDGFAPVGSNGFIYDSTGEAGLAFGAQSGAWKSLAAQTELGDKCSWTAQHLFGPYFSYSSSC